MLGHITSAALLSQFSVPQPWYVLGLAEVEHFSVTLVDIIFFLIYFAPDAGTGCWLLSLLLLLPDPLCLQ